MLRRSSLYACRGHMVGRTLRLLAHHDHIDVFAGDRRVASHGLGQPGQAVLELDHDLEILKQKPGAVRHARVVRKLGSEMTVNQQAFFQARPEAYPVFVRILLLTRRHTVESVIQGLGKGSQRAPSTWQPWRN